MPATLKSAVFFIPLVALMSFKERVLAGIVSGALSYSQLIDKEIRVKSPSFKDREDFILRFYPRNFLHLTGVGTILSSMDFYQKALDGTLSLADFDCDSSPDLKGRVRCKIRNLQNIGSFYQRVSKIEVDFSSNTVHCRLASTDGQCTIGFIGASVLVPNTLLNKDKIKEENAITDFEFFVCLGTAK